MIFNNIDEGSEMCTREGHKEQPHVHTMNNVHCSVVTVV